MRWPRALLAWLLIVVAESVHGTIRELWIAPLLGDLRARQVGVVAGSAIIFLIAWATIGWIGARRAGELAAVGALWVVLIVVFEFTLGGVLGYSWERMLSDYDVTAGGFMAFGLLFMACAPALALALRRGGSR